MNLGSDPKASGRGDGITPPPPGAGCGGPFGALVVGGLVLLAVGLGLFVGRCSAPAATPPAASVTVVRPTPNVVTAIRDLARLEGSEFQIERVIDLTEKQTRFFGLIETEDAILLVASGSVVAGVDLAELAEADVKFDAQAKRARIRLPAPKVLSSRIDNERTYVHTRQTGTLARRKESLETRARQEAERSLVEAAKEGGILERAAQNCRRTVESLVRSLGYSDVTIEIAPAK